MDIAIIIVLSIFVLAAICLAGATIATLIVDKFARKAALDWAKFMSIVSIMLAIACILLSVFPWQTTIVVIVLVSIGAIVLSVWIIKEVIESVKKNK